MKTTLSSEGQLLLPNELREQDGIEPGQDFEIERVDRGEYRLTILPASRNQGLVDWLLSCPEKGYFVAVESEGVSRPGGLG